MKIATSGLFLLFTLLLFPTETDAQQKGVSPISNTSISNTQSTYAVVVGISDYQDEGIPDLRFADKDALAFAGFLQSPAGGALDEDHLKVLFNENATQAQFAAALDWLWEVTEENDKAIIYFSGHGDVEKKSLTQPGYLLCWDAPSQIYMAGGAFPLSMMQEVISTISVQNKAKVIMVADACRAGKLSGSKVNGAQLTNSNLAKQYANEIKILSCQPDEYSIEGEQWGGGRGAFSYHLLDGLYGMADRNADQSVNLMEIRGYLEEKVSTEVEPQNQLPMTIGSGREKLTDVFPDILSKIKEGKEGHVQLFTATESRGIEDNVLAQADTNIVEMYVAFKKALKDKQFLFAEEGRPENDYADYYYEKLINEPSLEPLHSAIKRNYAAALQDDAQQLMNYWVKTDAERAIEAKQRDKKGKTTNEAFTKKVKSFPDYLERAAEILGSDHYMYATLQARKHFFKGYIIAESDYNPNEEEGNLALAEFRNGLQWQPEFPRAYLQIAKVFGWKLLQPDSAKIYAQKAIELHPNWTAPHVEMAWLFGKRFRQYDQVKVYLEEAIQFDSSSSVIWNAWGNYYLQQRNLAEAERHFEKAFELDSTFVYPITNLGIIYAQTRRFKEAEQFFRKSIEQDSTRIAGYLNLGILYDQTGRKEESEIYYEKALQIDSTQISVYINLGNLYRKTDRLKEASNIIKKGIQFDSTNAALYSVLALIHVDNQQYEEAEKNFKKAIQLNPGSYRSYINYGVILIEKLDRVDEAEQLFRKSLELDSNIWQVHINLGRCLRMQEQYEESASFIKKAIQLYPEYGPSYAALGQTYLYIPERLEEAKKELDRSIEMDPDFPDAYILLAKWSLKKNQLDKAWEHFEQGLEKNTDKEFFKLINLEDDPDFAEMRKDERWEELMKKYFQEENE